MKIIIASNNEGKIKEFKSMLNIEEVYSLEDIGFNEDIEEYGETYHINALIKAQTIAKKFPDYIVIADDSGLNVNLLDGRPGVYSARYAQKEEGYNEDKNLANNKLLLKELTGVIDRNAYFKCVMCIIKPAKEPMFFSGKLEGKIAKEVCEGEGFGYDPVFLYKGKPLSQMTVEEKNEISHRGEALQKVIKYIENEK